MVLMLTSCGYSNAEQKEKIEMFQSFDKTTECVVLTVFQLVVKDTHYDLSDIKYNDKKCNIVFLEDDGFYSYTLDRNNLCVEFLFTYYEDLKTVFLGSETMPSSSIAAGFFIDKSFCFRTTNKEKSTIYYFWNTETQQSTTIDYSETFRDKYEWSEDGNRSKDYSISYNSYAIKPYLEVTQNSTNITKRIDSSVLNTFEEGRKIKEEYPLYSNLEFNIARAFERNGDIFFISYFGVSPLGDPCYYYVLKWNFETEKCEFCTCYYFDEYQEWVDDMYVY